VSGLITGLKFGEGSHVKQNDPLVELNNDLIQKDKDIKRKQIAQAANLNKGIVRAPFDGIILEKLKETGEWLIPGSAVCRIASTNDLVVSVAVPESLIRYQ